ncbi:MAG: DUF3006 domain-containing protein [Armatimonadetes bacterium]|nr:DUF3006 domain-containing protein [Armatimonadota bacterium]MDW8154794.1 DUF3006 family protein [Armatimonadota bacterium]
MRRRGVVDRIEEEVAVVFLEDGNAAFLPRTVLPPGSMEGSDIELTVRLRTTRERRSGRRIPERSEDGP